MVRAAIAHAAKGTRLEIEAAARCRTRSFSARLDIVVVAECTEGKLHRQCDQHGHS